MCPKTQLFSLDFSPKAPRVILATLLLATVAASSSMAEVPEQARAAIDRVIGSRGTYIADERVYKVILPREAATIVQDYQTLSPNIGLNSWVAFMPAIHHEALLTGQLLLLEDEVDSVLTTLLNAGLDVTGLADPGPLDTILSMKGSVSEGAYRAAVGRRAILHGETI